MSKIGHKITKNVRTSFVLLLKTITLPGKSDKRTEMQTPNPSFHALLLAFRAPHVLHSSVLILIIIDELFVNSLWTFMFGFALNLNVQFLQTNDSFLRRSFLPFHRV